jgi:hypothetical protein
MRDICRIAVSQDRLTVCIVAQQLRSADVFDAWLKSFHKWFRLWRIPEELGDGLGEGSGYVVHVGMLR